MGHISVSRSLSPRTELRSWLRSSRPARGSRMELQPRLRSSRPARGARMELPPRLRSSRPAREGAGYGRRGEAPGDCGRFPSRGWASGGSRGNQRGPSRGRSLASTVIVGCARRGEVGMAPGGGRCWSSDEVGGRSWGVGARAGSGQGVKRGRERRGDWVRWCFRIFYLGAVHIG
jgi:hypothetical protein